MEAMCGKAREGNAQGMKEREWGWVVKSRDNFYLTLLKEHFHPVWVIFPLVSSINLKFPPNRPITIWNHWDKIRISDVPSLQLFLKLKVLISFILDKSIPDNGTNLYHFQTMDLIYYSYRNWQLINWTTVTSNFQYTYMLNQLIISSYRYKICRLYFQIAWITTVTFSSW